MEELKNNQKGREHLFEMLKSGGKVSVQEIEVLDPETQTVKTVKLLTAGRKKAILSDKLHDMLVSRGILERI